MTIELALTLTLIAIGYSAYLILRGFFHYQQVLQRHEQQQRQALQELQVEFKKQHETEFIISERIGSLGFYNGKEIPSQVKLEDGRLFEYESLAIKTPQGFYKSTDPNTLHIKVDGNLLYKFKSDK